jgi:hypothetical protein
VRYQKNTHEHPAQSKISKGSAWISLMQELGDVAANIQAVCSSIFGSEPDFSDTFLTNSSTFPHKRWGLVMVGKCTNSTSLN